MSRYDGLIIPRSYSEYINKTDAATLQQALQLPGVLSGAVAAGDNKAVTSNAVADALGEWEEVWRQDSDNYILGVKNSLGTWLRIRFSGLISGNISNAYPLLVLPQEWRPVISAPNRFIASVETPEVRLTAGLDFNENGSIMIYFQGNTPKNGTVTVSGIYCDVFMNIR